MKKVKSMNILIAPLILLLVLSVLFLYKNGTVKKEAIYNSPESEKKITPAQYGEIEFHGPRYAASDAPNEYGFWSFALVEQNKISRSGQPNYNDFQYLKNKGYKTVINLRFVNEYEETTSDLEIKGVKDMGFQYYEIPIRDGGVPTEEQALRYLEIIKDPSKMPIHIHCRGGFGRTGLMVALYRYEINRWPMEKAIEESRLFEGGVNDTQRDWLLAWARKKSN